MVLERERKGLINAQLRHRFSSTLDSLRRHTLGSVAYRMIGALGRCEGLMSRMKTLLVTGGAGFVGSALIRQLVEDTDSTVVNVDALTYAGDLDSLAGARLHPRHVFEHVDIRKRADVERLFREHRPDAVMHLAAETHVDLSIEGPTAFVETNVQGTCNLLEAA